MKKISIIIPNYNGEKYIDTCLRSLLVQTLKEIEIIVVNDGSTDESSKICEKYQRIDSRIKIINKNNEGVSIARNKGIELAKADYLMFIDVDDWIEPTMCEECYNAILKDKSDFVICNHIIERFSKSSKVIFNTYKSIFYKNEIVESVILPLIEESDNNTIHERASFRSPWGKLFKKSIIQKNNIEFNKDLVIGEDLIFNLNYLKYCNTVSCLNSYLYHYRINDDSVMIKYKSNAWIVYKNLINVLENELKDNISEELYFQRLNKLKIKYLFACIRNEFNILNNKTILQKKSYIKEICEDKMIELPLKNFRGKAFGKKQSIILFLLRNKMYLIYVIWKKIRN